MRLSLYRVSGDSMRPAFCEGDFVITWQTHRLKIGDVITVNHPRYGLIIKRISQIDRSSDLPSLTLNGDNRRLSTPSDALGVVSIEQVLGKVLWHIKQPKVGNCGLRSVNCKQINRTD